MSFLRVAQYFEVILHVEYVRLHRGGVEHGQFVFSQMNRPLCVAMLELNTLLVCRWERIVDDVGLGRRFEQL